MNDDYKRFNCLIDEFYGLWYLVVMVDNSTLPILVWCSYLVCCNILSLVCINWHMITTLRGSAVKMTHYGDVIMGKMASQITSLAIVYSTVYSGADQRKHKSSASLAFVRGIHRGPVNSPHKWPVMRKMFPFDDVIMKFCGFCWLHVMAGCQDDSSIIGRRADMPH